MFDALFPKLRWLRRAARRRVEDRDARRDPLPFGEAWVRRFLPHYFKAEPSLFHRDLYADLRDFHRVRGQHENRRAPRGAAKSGVGVKAYTLWAALERIEPFTFLFSESGPQAKGLLADVRSELEGNAAVAAAYPDAAGVGRTWRDGELVLRNGCKIAAAGVGARTRGVGHKSERPSLIICDDLNGDDDAFSPTQRQRKLSWFAKNLMNLGDSRTNFLVYGTPIHREAVTCQLTDGDLSAGWNTRGYASVRRWPDRMDLWSEWEQLRSNLGDRRRTETSDAYYAANRGAMDAGAEVLWPEWDGLYALMCRRAAVGPAAFACEKQDEVGTEGSTEWPAAYFDRPDLWFWEWPELSHRVQVLDPSKGVGDDVGDFQAHVWGGLGAEDGVIYLDALLRREDATAMVSTGLDVCRDFRPDVWSFEDNGTLGLLDTEVRRQLADRAAARRPQMCPLEAYTSTDPKASRIRYLGVYLSAGRVRVRNTPGGRMLVQQIREWPNGSHDDGPDAAGSLVRRLERLVAEGV